MKNPHFGRIASVVLGSALVACASGTANTPAAALQPAAPAASAPAANPTPTAPTATVPPADTKAAQSPPSPAPSKSEVDQTNSTTAKSDSEAKPSTAEPGCTKLAGRTGEAPEWGSGWIDLAALASFDARTKLKINVGGSATKILVRLLKDGQLPDQPVGVLGKYAVPSGRLLEVPITGKKANITQISVHGSPKAWTYHLGADNGPATIEEVEYCK